MFYQSESANTKFGFLNQTNKTFFLKVKGKSVVFAFLLCLISGGQNAISAQQAGALDAGFGNGGIVTTQFGDGTFSNEVHSVAVQPNGKIVVVGSTGHFGDVKSDFAVARYNSDGALDTTFGDAGRAITAISDGEDSAYTILLQPDGKIIAVGSADGRTFAIARYNANGSLDASFGSGGKVITQWEGYGKAYAAALQPDGKIIVVGVTVVNTYDFAIARYNSDGSLDTSFGNGGKVSTEINSGYVFSEFAFAVAVQADSKIVVAGSSSNGSSSDFAITRYNPNGSLDRSFDDDGIAVQSITPGAQNIIRTIAIQTDGKIVAAGTSTDYNSFSDAALARFNTNGTLDQTFGFGGKVVTNLTNSYGDKIESISIRADGKIVAAGASNESNNNNGSNNHKDFTIFRYNANGSLDGEFGTNGAVITPINLNDEAFSVAIQPNGKIVAAGLTGLGRTYADPSAFAIARYNADGFTAPRRAQFDFDGDGKSDVSVFRPNNGGWYLNCSTAGFAGLQFGFFIDKPVPADYDGDGKTDVAVFRYGNWYILNSSNNAFRSIRFGLYDDVPIPADYDGDGTSDIAVFRRGFWYFLNSSNNQSRAFKFGLESDKPVPSDFDGNNKTDVAVFREGFWYWLEEATNQFRGIHFGTTGDKPIAADYDGDGKADQAVFRNGVWYLNRSTVGFTGVQFGVASDVPTPADYDGDGKADISVFRDGNWYRLNSGNNQFFVQQFGIPTDEPVPAAFNQ